MSAIAAARRPLVPLFYEGTDFWNELVAELQLKVAAINITAVAHGFVSESLLLRQDSDLSIKKEGSPSTEIRLRLNFEPWGPVVRGVIKGQQQSGQPYCNEEFDVPIARDLDGSVVAIFDEGRSFSSHDLSRYLLRSFRRCFPNLALPC